MAEHQTAIVSHRAHCGTHPENTLLGIQAALEAGMIATDIREYL